MEWKCFWIWRLIDWNGWKKKWMWSFYLSFSDNSSSELFTSLQHAITKSCLRISTSNKLGFFLLEFFLINFTFAIINWSHFFLLSSLFFPAINFLGKSFAFCISSYHQIIPSEPRQATLYRLCSHGIWNKNCFNFSFCHRLRIFSF